MFKRGNIVLVLFPNSDLVSAKRRPALIIQSDNFKSELNQVIVAMISSKMFRANNPARVSVLLSTDQVNKSGLLTDSVVMTDNIATVSTSAIDFSIGLLNMTEIDAALAYTLDFNQQINM